MSPPTALIDALRAAFAAHADPVSAAPMQAYMKSALPFYGIAAPLRRKLTADAVKAQPCADTAALAQTMRALSCGARFREEHEALKQALKSLEGLRLAPLPDRRVRASD